MKITYGGNKMSAKICEIKDFEYLQKLIYTERMLKHMQQYLHRPIPQIQLYPIIQKKHHLLKVNFNNSHNQKRLSNLIRLVNLNSQLNFPFSSANKVVM